MRHLAFIITISAAAGLVAQQAANPRQQPGASITVFAPDQHDLYDGRFVMSASRIHMVGTLNVKVGRGERSPARRNPPQKIRESPDNIHVKLINIRKFAGRECPICFSLSSRLATFRQ